MAYVNYWQCIHMGLVQKASRSLSQTYVISKKWSVYMEFSPTMLHEEWNNYLVFQVTTSLEEFIRKCSSCIKQPTLNAYQYNRGRDNQSTLDD